METGESAEHRGRRKRGRDKRGRASRILGATARHAFSTASTTVRYAQIASAIQQLGKERLKPVKEALPEEVTYDEIRLVATHLRVQQINKAAQSRGEFAPQCGPS